MKPAPAAKPPVPDAPKATVPVANTALTLLAVAASLFTLHWARAVFVPLLLGLMFSYALTPVVRRMVALHVPRGLAAALVLSCIVGGAVQLSYKLSDQAAALIETLPAAAKKLRQAFQGQPTRGPGAAIETMQRAAAEIERAAEDGTVSNQPPTRGVSKVQIERARFNVKDYLWPGALGLAAAVSQVAVVLCVTFFLLASGDRFRRKAVHLAGPTFARRKLTLQMLDEVNTQIQRYLMVHVLASVVVGVSTWLVFWGLGMDNAAVWGVASFVLNFIPYLGNIAITGGAALLALVQFGQVEMAVLVAGASLLIHALVGSVLTPWWTGKASRMNAVAVFAGVLAWGWLWGIAGLFMGMPILMAIKAVCDRVDEFKAVGELLGE
jgi:predicted PurR-regulated permease PerM